MQTSTQTNQSITNDPGSVNFQCPRYGLDPSCKGETIIRTVHERKIVTTYTCPSCGFTGPN